MELVVEPFLTRLRILGALPDGILKIDTLVDKLESDALRKSSDVPVSKLWLERVLLLLLNLNLFLLVFNLRLFLFFLEDLFHGT